MTQEMLFVAPPVSESRPAPEAKPATPALKLARAPKAAPQDEPRAPAPRRRRESGILAQTRAAFRPETRLATFLGAILGAFVPIAVWVVAHREINASRPLWSQFGSLLVLGGLLYSATTVFSWGKQAFRSSIKAAGFVVLLEGVLVGSQTHWLSLAALSLLAGINAIATGAILSTEET